MAEDPIKFSWRANVSVQGGPVWAVSEELQVGSYLVVEEVIVPGTSPVQLQSGSAEGQVKFLMIMADKEAYSSGLLTYSVHDEGNHTTKFILDGPVLLVKSAVQVMAKKINFEGSWPTGSEPDPWYLFNAPTELQFHNQGMDEYTIKILIGWDPTP